MQKMKILICGLALATLPLHAQAEGRINYRFIDSKVQTTAALPLLDAIHTYGHGFTLVFDKTRESHDITYNSSTYSSPQDFKGYAQHVAIRPDRRVVIAGHNSERSSWAGFDDRRRPFILLKDAKGKKTLKLQELKKDRLSFALAVDKDNQSILLSGGQYGYTIMVFDTHLKVQNSVHFGNSSTKAHLAITQEGTYAVIGWDSQPEARTESPTYWEFSPELKIIAQRTLSTEEKSKSSTCALTRVLTYEDALYAAYGTDHCLSAKNKKGNITIRKVRGSSGTWEEEQSIPFTMEDTYLRNGQFFISQDGDPYFLAPAAHHLHQIKFSRKTGAQSHKFFNKPDALIQCFPPKWVFNVVDVFQDAEGNDNVLLSSRPLDHPFAGCVAIGNTQF